MDTLYGYFDHVDDTWIGTDAGPILVSTAELVMNQPGRQVRAALLGQQLGFPQGRISMVEWVPRVVHRKDKIDIMVDAETALAQLEGDL